MDELGLYWIELAEACGWTDVGDVRVMNITYPLRDGSSVDYKDYLCLVASPVPEVPAIQDVYIDIKPGSDRNPINLKSKGVVPVAVFGTEDFDVTLIDDPLGVALFDVDTQVLYGTFPVHWAIEDIDWDGYDDMILHFETQELLGYLDQYSVAACLMGLTVDGQLFVGTDAVDAFIKGKKK